jgi:hypothetical protein
MKYTHRFITFLLLLLGAAPAVHSASEKTALIEQLAQCAALSDNQQRLTCYDDLVRNLASNTGQSQDPDLIQPPASFLDSRLVAVPWKTEYSLTVRSFVELISQAVMGNGKKVTVQGWTRDERHYILNITMRTPVKLRFLPREGAKQDTPMSLLKEVTMDGETVSAEEFIMVIAAMVPFE